MSRVVIVLALLIAPLGGAAQSRDAADAGQAVRLMVEQTNQFRRSQGLAPISPNAQLERAALDFARFMARTDRYGHDADGRAPVQRAAAQGYAYCLVSENIAMEFSSAGFETADLAQQFVAGWKRSPGHRRNMLDPNAVDTGVAVARSARSGRYYAVQMFGRPLALRTTFRIANRSPLTLSYELGGESYRLPPHAVRTHEQCHADELRVHVPGQGEAVTVAPANGDRYAIEREGSRYRFTKG